MDEVRAFPQASNVALDFVSKVGQVARAEVGQANILEAGPHMFVRVEFRSTGRKGLDRQAPLVLAKERPHHAGAVNGSAIPDISILPFRQPIASPANTIAQQPQLSS